ncbi:flavodoxin domain-containing protein [Maribellus sediminis]|uniref:flavodoxin domain-containing protein n=1 Tax=Maribellus sediminis TaxID=2696285 RepID=UPI0014309B06|nr:flavodoxin domain-containing protein [Maribellus sediminis]
MKTLITYCTTHGCTKKVVSEIAQFLGEGVTTCNLKKESAPDVSEFDRVIIGGSIHAGQIQKKVKEFCKNNVEALQKTELGLFICCMEEGEKAEAQLQEAFPEELLIHAKATACLGGEFNFKKMNFMEKLIVKKVAKIDHSTSKVNYDAIHSFSNNMNKIFNPFLFFV